MRFISLFSKLLTLGILLAFLPLASYAKAGCCSRHGGVAGCNSTTGYQRCKDNSDSPSCKCDGSTAKATKNTKATTNTTATTTTTAPAAAATPAAADTTTKSTKGCCARHGGVAKCDKKTGHQVCKDGTQSATCTC